MPMSSSLNDSSSIHKSKMKDEVMGPRSTDTCLTFQ
jgi:hypothetical protein